MSIDYVGQISRSNDKVIFDCALRKLNTVTGVDRDTVSYLPHAFIDRSCSSELVPSVVPFFLSLVVRGYNPRRYWSKNRTKSKGLFYLHSATPTRQCYQHQAIVSFQQIYLRPFPLPYYGLLSALIIDFSALIIDFSQLFIKLSFNLMAFWSTFIGIFD